MNRELKFRIWDNYLKKFLNSSVRNLEFLKTYLEIIDQSDFGAASFFIQETALIPQQFTGLKDKNGKDIYEGDILKYGDLYYEVMWIDYQWVATCPYYNHCHWPKFESFGREARASIVSGNIFENPELLHIANNE